MNQTLSTPPRLLPLFHIPAMRILGGCVLAAMLALTTLLRAQTITLTADERAVAEAGDCRDAATLVRMFGRSPALDERILLTLGSVQSATAVTAIMERLASPTSAVRIAAAFAAGQTLGSAAIPPAREKALIGRLKAETEAAVRAAVADALGRCGTRLGLDAVIAMPADDPSLADAQAMAIARFAIRGITSPAATARAAALLPVLASRPSLNSAAYALLRIGTRKLLEPHEKALLEASASTDPQTRMLVVSALGRIGSPAAMDRVLGATTDADWRVSVNALRATASFRGDAGVQVRVAAALRAALLSGGHHQVRTALEALPMTGITDTAFAALLVEGTHRSKGIAEAAMQALCRMFPARAAAMIADSMKANLNLSPMILRAIGLLVEREKKVRQEFQMPLLLSLLNPDPLRSYAAMESWIALFKLEMRTGRRPAEIQRYTTSLISALSYHSEPYNRNTGAVELIVAAMEDSLLRSPEFAPHVIEAMGKFSSSDAVETVMTLIDCLGALGNTSAVPTLRRCLEDPNPAVRRRAHAALRRLGVKTAEPSVEYTGSITHDWQAIGALPERPIVTMVTSKGTIRIALEPRLALFTVDAIARLCRDGFFSSLTFHRVVPNFVVQGGDPKGDGTGGPPFTLRSEFSPRSFVRGTVGIASAGKDTEGSQFFIMHSAAPHLDGRYSIIGDVIEGMEVVDALEVGDMIRTMTIGR